MKFRQKIIYALAGVFLITGIFCRGEGADDPREEITPEHVNALLTRIVNVEKQMQENVALYPRVTRVITLGNTGSGKSTLVHALGERQMIVGEDADGELFIDVNKKHMIENSS